MKPRLLIADDHTLVLEGLRKILEAECELVGTVEDGRALMEAARQLNPDLILLDISMPLLNGIEAARQIRKSNPDAKLIFVTMHGDPDYVREAMRTGASGYVLKRSAASELVTAIREVLKGKTYVTPLVTKGVAGSLTEVSPHASRTFGGLTTRQREVLQLVSEGRSGKEIAAVLHVSVKTVEFHKASIMRALGLRTTAELTRYAIEHGLSGA